MADTYTFFYFGDDEAYFKALQTEFKKSLKVAIEFKKFYDIDEKNIQSFYLLIFQSKPAVVFIDFSKQTLEYLHLARLISRIRLEQKVITVGLVDYLSPPQVLAESVATGVCFTHVKGTETFDVGFNITKLLLPNENTEHGFATADLKESWKGGAISKVGFVHFEGLHIETNLPLKKGDRLKIKHFWQTKKTVPSGEIVVQDFGNTNLYYHYDQWADLSFYFMDEFIPPEGMEPPRIKESLQERDAYIVYHKKLLKKWIGENLQDSLEKKGKVFVIDSELNFYNNQKRSDKYPYVIRCTPYLMDIIFELDRLKPLVIAFSLDKADNKEPKNTLEVLQKVGEHVRKSMADLSPYIVIFNAPESHTSGIFQDLLQYKNVLASKDNLSVELLLRMAEIYEKKKVIGQLKSLKGDRVYLNKIKPSSICELLIPIQVTKLSESDMIFTSEYPIPQGVNLHLVDPVDMYVNVQPFKGQNNAAGYQGLIHGIGEHAKMDLRKFVNTIFFRDHDATVLAELEEFKKLNVTKMQEKIAALQAKKAEEEAKKAEEAKKKEEDAKKAEEAKLAQQAQNPELAPVSSETESEDPEKTPETAEKKA